MSAVLAHAFTARQEPMPAPTEQHDYPTRVPEIIGVSVFSIILASAPVLARLFFRRSSKLPLLWDDWLIIIAAVLAIADASLYLVCLRHGFGRKMETLTPETLVSFFELVWATFLLYGAAVSFVKFSVLAFYHRIFPRSFPKTLVVLTVISALWWILITLITIFQCIPIQKNWDDRVEGACLNYLNVYIAIQVLNIVLDAAILVLPIRAVAKLQMARANKISVAATFALGGLAVIFAIVRLYILIANRNQTDITYETATASWSLIEPCFEIFCACLPCMTPLVKAGRTLVTRMSSLSSSLRSSGNRLLSGAGGSGGSSSEKGFVSSSSSSSKPGSSGDGNSNVNGICTTCGSNTFNSHQTGGPGGINVSTTWSQARENPSYDTRTKTGAVTSAETRVQILGQPRQPVRDEELVSTPASPRYNEFPGHYPSPGTGTATTTPKSVPIVINQMV